MLKSKQNKQILPPIREKITNLNKFFTLYEKIWLSFFIITGIIVTIVLQENILFLIVLMAGLIMELTLAKRSKWCFLFVFINSAGLIVIGFITSLYSEMLINLLFWIPYAIIGFILWSKNIDKKENKKLTEVRNLKIWQTMLIILTVLGFIFLWSRVLISWNDSQPILDAASTFFQLSTGILILLRIKEQWIFWIGYIFISATIWIFLQQWVMLIISVGYLSNSIYGFFNWSKYLKTKKSD